MYCSNCGKQIWNGANFCAFCGEKITNTHDRNQCENQGNGVNETSVNLDCETPKEKGICLKSVFYFLSNLFPLVSLSFLIIVWQDYYYRSYWAETYWYNKPIFSIFELALLYILAFLLFIGYIQFVRYLFRLQEQGIYSIPLPFLIKSNKWLIYVIYPFFGIAHFIRELYVLFFLGVRETIGITAISLLIGATLIGFVFYCKSKFKYIGKTRRD